MRVALIEIPEEKLCSQGAKNKPVSLVELSLSCQSQRLRSQVTFDYVTSQFIIEDSSRRSLARVRSRVFVSRIVSSIGSDHLSRFRFGAAFSDNWDQPRVFVFRTDVIFGPHPSCYFVGVVPRGRTRVWLRNLCLER